MKDRIESALLWTFPRRQDGHAVRADYPRHGGQMIVVDMSREPSQPATRTHSAALRPRSRKRARNRREWMRSCADIPTEKEVRSSC
jgi:hypothetical protein